MHFGGTNLDQGQAFNRRLVLEAIRVHGALSRAELTRLTGLAPQTISNISAALIDSELLLSQKRQGGSRGQPATDLKLNPGGGCAFGVSIDHDRLFAVAVDLAGNKLCQAEKHLAEPEPEKVLPAVASTIDGLLQQVPAWRDRILGTGIAMSGLTTQGKFIGLAPDPATELWQNFPLDRELRAKLSMPIFTDNDARAAAVGEALYGEGRRHRTFIYIYFGVGVGGGIINGGQPLRGSRGRAGEFGHMVVSPGGRPCPCGNRGCLEQYVSVTSALKSIAGDAGSGTPDSRILRALLREDHGLRAWIDEAVGHIRTAITNLENIFDPQAVLLGGIIPELLLDIIVDRIQPLPRTVASRKEGDTQRVIKSSIGPEIPAMGAASLALFDATSADLSLLFKKNAKPIPKAASV